MHTRQIALLETLSDLTAVDRMGVLDEVRRIVLSPVVMELLEQRGLDYELPEEIVPVEEIEAQCVSTYEALRGLFDRLDQQPELVSVNGPAVFRSALWDTGAYLDALVMRSLVISRLAADSPERFIAASSESKDLPVWCFSHMSVPRPTRFWSWVLRELNPDIPVQWLDASVDARTEAPVSAFRSRIRKRLESSPSVWSAIVSWRKGDWRNLLRCITGTGTKTLLIIGAECDWGRIASEMSARGWCILFDAAGSYLPSSFLAEADGSEREAFAGTWNEFLDELPACVRPATGSMRRWLCQVVGAAARIQAHALEVCRLSRNRRRVGAVLNANSASGVAQIALRAYRCLGVPVVKWQHGSIWLRNRVTQRMDDADAASADVQFTYGPGSTAAYSAAGRTKQCRFVEVGGAGLDSYSREMRVTKDRVAVGGRKILYVTTNYTLGNWYCGFSPPLMDGTYYRGQLRVIEELLTQLGSSPEASLTIKPPGNYFVDYPPPWIDRLEGVDRCRVADARDRLSELMAQHDVIVIDCATTTLLEALCTRAHVFALCTSPRWGDQDLEILGRRAVWSTDPGELMGALSEYMKTGAYQPDLANRDFLRKHGLAADDGRGTEKVMGILSEVLSDPCRN